MTEKEKKLKDEIALLFKNAREEGPIRKWEDGVTDAEEVLSLIEEADSKSPQAQEMPQTTTRLDYKEQKMLEKIVNKLIEFDGWNTFEYYKRERWCQFLKDDIIPIIEEAGYVLRDKEVMEK